MTREEIFHAQRSINAAGLGPVAADGVWGPHTAAAYAELARESDLGGVGMSVPTPAAPKPWWTSRAVLGALATIAAGIAGFAGVSLDAGQLTDTLAALVSAVGGGLALWGSIRRTAPIDQGLVAPGVRVESGRLCRDSVPPDDAGDHGGYWSGEHGPFEDRLDH